MRSTVVVTALVMLGAAIGIRASDRVGIYAVVDKVVFEPAGATPERVQIWGAFAVAKPNDRDLYQAVQRGYLYFTVAEARDLTRAEWSDLHSVASGKRIVGFGSRAGQSVRVRGEHERPRSPDRYTLGVGVQMMQAARDYAPIRELSAHLSR